MVWDVMVAAAFVVVSVAVLARSSGKHVLTRLKKPYRRLLPFPSAMILSRHRFREIVRPHSYAGPYFDRSDAKRKIGLSKWSAAFRRIWSNHREETSIILAAIITLVALSAWCTRNQQALANLLYPPSKEIKHSELEIRWSVTPHSSPRKHPEMPPGSRP